MGLRVPQALPTSLSFLGRVRPWSLFECFAELKGLSQRVGHQHVGFSLYQYRSYHSLIEGGADEGLLASHIFYH
jgi:hypothetical protein